MSKRRQPNFHERSVNEITTKEKSAAQRQKARRTEVVSVPTGSNRHTTKVREGRISHEVFAKRELAKIPKEEF